MSTLAPTQTATFPYSLNARKAPVRERPLHVYRSPLNPKANGLQPCIGELREGGKWRDISSRGRDISSRGKRVNRTL